VCIGPLGNASSGVRKGITLSTATEEISSWRDPAGARHAGEEGRRNSSRGQATRMRLSIPRLNPIRSALGARNLFQSRARIDGADVGLFLSSGLPTRRFVGSAGAIANASWI